MTDGNDADQVDPTGVYTLITVNGAEVPATVVHDGREMKIHSGTFTINADGTCSSKMLYSFPSGPERTREVDATYTQSDSTLDMQWEGAGRTKGTVKGDTFTMNNAGMIVSYRR
jgi:hypothetical protein